MKIVLDANYMNTQEEMHDYLKEKFQFPDYYGKNLDALYDCLSESDDLEAELIHYNPSDSIVKSMAAVMKAAGVKVTEVKADGEEFQGTKKAGDGNRTHVSSLEG